MPYAYNLTGNATYPALALSPDQGSGRPSAFINYILFDETFTPLEAKSQPVGSNANVLHAVTLPTITVQQTGYLYVYLSYDNATGADVYFDDFKITYQESPVVQINSYYPFGLVAFSWIREGEKETKEKFQGKEYDEKTGYYDFGSRLYAPVEARWFANDPKG
jgi:RHS repeat-associated protein